MLAPLGPQAPVSLLCLVSFQSKEVAPSHH